MNDFKLTNTSKGFTGVPVFNERSATVFHGTSTTESFLYMTLADAKSECLLHSLNIGPHKNT